MYSSTSRTITFKPKNTSTQSNMCRSTSLAVKSSSSAIQRKKRRRRPNARPVVAELAHQPLHRAVRRVELALDLCQHLALLPDHRDHATARAARVRAWASLAASTRAGHPQRRRSAQAPPPPHLDAFVCRPRLGRLGGGGGRVARCCGCDLARLYWYSSTRVPMPWVPLANLLPSLQCLESDHGSNSQVVLQYSSTST